MGESDRRADESPLCSELDHQSDFVQAVRCARESIGVRAEKVSITSRRDVSPSATTPDHHSPSNGERDDNALEDFSADVLDDQVISITRNLQGPLLPITVASANDRRRTAVPDQILFNEIADKSDDLSSSEMSELNSRMAEASGCPGDQHLLTWLKFA